MKVLLSAYECQPNTGSEYGLGWAWASGLVAMGHEIWVITLSDNQARIESEVLRNPISNLHFIYCKMPSWLPWGYKIANFMRSQIAAQTLSHIAKIVWQWDAFLIAKLLTRELKFDLVHHVTNSMVRRPSFMGFLGVPFIFGPLAGGVKTPWLLRKNYPPSGLLKDLMRDLVNAWIRFDPLMHLSFASALKIYCDSVETKKLIPQVYQSKSAVLFSVPNFEPNSFAPQSFKDLAESESFRVLYVGRFLYWKGIHLALKAFRQLLQNFPSARFTLIGGGREQAWLKKLAEQLGLDEAIEWISWLNRKQLSSAYQQHDVLLFPSLHDTSPNVIFESFHYGLPVVCLDLGGPGVMVDDTCGRVIRTDGLSEEVVIFTLGRALIELAEDSKLRHSLSQGALARVTKFPFQDVLKHIYSEIKVG